MSEEQVPQEVQQDKPETIKIERNYEGEVNILTQRLMASTGIEIMLQSTLDSVVKEKIELEKENERLKLAYDKLKSETEKASTTMGNKK